MGFKDWINNLVRRKASSMAAFMSPGTGQAVWSGRNYAVFAKEAYTKNWASHKAIDMIGKSVGSVPWGVYKETDNGRELLPSHSLNDLVSLSKTRVNLRETFGMLNKKLVSYLCVSGNAFVRKVSPDTGPNKGVPQLLEVLRPDRMRIMVDGIGRVTGYEYRVVSGNSYIMGESLEGIQDGLTTRTYNYPVNPETGESEVLHLQLSHLLDDYWGLSPTEPIARNVDTSNAMAEWNMKLLQKEARPGLIIKVNGRLTNEQYERMKSMFRNEYAGSENAGSTIILEGGESIDATPYGFSPADIDYINGSRDESRKISNVYGVPAMLLGIPGDNTYSNYQEARKAFWEETVVFYLCLLRDCYNWWLFDINKGDEFIDFDLDGIPALEPDRQIRWDRANNSQFLTINEKREMCGYEAIEGGDVLLVPIASIPLEEASLPTSDRNPEEEEDEEPVTEEDTEEDEEKALELIRGKVKEEDIPDFLGDNGI